MKSAIQASYNSIFNATIGKLWITRFWDGIDRNLSSSRPSLSRIDIVLALGLGLAGMIVSIWGFAQTNRVPGLHTMIDLFLHADVVRMTQNVVSMEGIHGRTNVHPLRSLLLYPFGALLTALGMDPLTSAKSLIVLVMGALAALFSLVVRLLGLPRYAVALFTLLFMLSASFLFWGTIVEIYTFCCFSVLAALFLMFRVERAHWGWWVAINVLMLSFLITNWMFGLIATAVRYKPKPFLAIALSSFFLVVALSVVQNMMFERAALFFNIETLLRETQYLQPVMQMEGTYEDGWRPGSNLRSLYLTTVVAMPAYVQEFKGKHVAATNQNSGFPEGEISPVIAVVAWIVLLGMGLWGAVKCKDMRLPLIGAGIMLALQSLLHIIYGEVTFYYSLNFLPLLILFASLAWFAPYRKVGLGSACCVILFGGVNNERRLQETIDLADCLANVETVQKIQTREMNREKLRVDDPDFPDVNYENLCQTQVPQ